MKKKNVLFASLMLMLCSTLEAEIRRITHSDGRVEFTNVGKNGAVIRHSKSDANIYRYTNNEGVLTFANRRPVNMAYDVMRFDCYACQTTSKVDWSNTRLFHSHFNDEIESMAARFAIEPALVKAVIHAESAFNPHAVSPKGAQGLMQLMPRTAQELGVSNPMDVRQNIYGGTKYLSQMLNSFNGDIRLATAAYNAGPGNVRRYRGVPPFAETQAYIERVAILHERYQRSNQ